jgi:hypothetical protein
MEETCETCKKLEQKILWAKQDRCACDFLSLTWKLDRHVVAEHAKMVGKNAGMDISEKIIFWESQAKIGNAYPRGTLELIGEVRQLSARVKELEETVQMKIDENPPIFTVDEWRKLSAWQRLRINSIYHLASRAINDINKDEEKVEKCRHGVAWDECPDCNH